MVSFNGLSISRVRQFICLFLSYLIFFKFKDPQHYVLVRWPHFFHRNEKEIIIELLFKHRSEQKSFTVMFNKLAGRVLSGYKATRQNVPEKACLCCC